jgi:hypothetical protein
MTEWRRVVVLAVRMMSSTYNNKYAREEPRQNTKSEESLLEAEKPSVAIKEVKR